MMEGEIHADAIVDGGPLGCGELLVLLHGAMRDLQPGQIMEAVTYDPGAKEDLPAWCRMVGHTILKVENGHYFLRKGPAPEGSSNTSQQRG